MAEHRSVKAVTEFLDIPLEFLSRSMGGKSAGAGSFCTSQACFVVVVVWFGLLRGHVKRTQIGDTCDLRESFETFLHWIRKLLITLGSRFPLTKPQV